MHIANARDFINIFYVSTVIVKDLSRLGRDYVTVGQYTDIYFPDHNVRFIAISDNVDSAKGMNDLLPINNLMNEWYSRDISKKIESELEYPGQIKVNVIRESRVIDYAK